MLSKDITFADLDGNPITETFYFNLTKADIAQMELEEKGGMEAVLKQLVKTQDGATALRLLDKILKRAYGIKSEDGRRFIKSEEIWQEFKQTEAYSELFIELVTDGAKAGEFMNALLPKGLKPGQPVVTAGTNAPELAEPKEDPEPWLTEDREPTKKEMMAMDRDQLNRAIVAKSKRKARLQTVPTPPEDPELEAMRAALSEE